MTRLRVAAVSFSPQYEAISANLSRVEQQVRCLSARGADLVCFPEMSLTGFGRTPAILALAQPPHGPVVMRLLEIARSAGSAVLAGLPILAGDRRPPFVSQVFCAPEGDCYLYHKVHLSQRELGVFSAGDDLGVFTWRSIGLGLQLCQDTHFPEMSLAQASCGAQILLMPFASPMGDPEALRSRWLRFLPARAYDTGSYVLAFNQAGFSPSGKYFSSLILAFDPEGKLLVERCSDQPGEVIVDLDLEAVEAARRRRPFLRLRRPEIYRFERIGSQNDETRPD